MSGKSQKNVRVFLRVRPPIKVELERKDVLNCVNISPTDPTVCVLTNPKKKTQDGQDEAKDFTFHRCFDANSTQDDVYERVARDTIDDVFQGYHGLIFVYGQTGTGKTHTLCCQDEGNEGILYNSVVEIFSRIQQDSKREYECSLQFVQIYNEIIQDLLSTNKQNVVSLRDDPENDGAVYLPQCNTVSVATAGECLKWYLTGDKRRVTGETLMNFSSSRSHTVFMLDVVSRPRMTKADVDNPDALSGEADSVKQGRLILVDLAGSEKVKKTHSEGIRLAEANSINGSLLVLGRVVNALTEGKTTHVPFRESKLTRLLQYPLSGMGKTSIIVTCGPSLYNYDESHAAILFGQRAMKLKVNAKVHQKVDWKALALKLQAILEGGMDSVRVETLDAQAKDFERQVEVYRERAERAERQLTEQGDQDAKELAEQNHALRELVKALQNKVIKLDDKRKEDRKSKKQLQQQMEAMVTANMAKEVQMQETEQQLKLLQNQLIEAQNQSIELSNEVRRLHKECLKHGLSGRDPRITLVHQSMQYQAVPPTKSSTQQKSTNGDHEGFIHLEDEDSGDEGTLEVGSPTVMQNTQAQSDYRDDKEAYGDTSQQLVRAVQEVQSLRVENQRLLNEAKISELSSRKALLRIQEVEKDSQRVREYCSLLEEQIRVGNTGYQDLQKQLQEAQKENGAVENERFHLLLSKMKEYESRMDKYKGQMQRATNEARIEANAKNKLNSKLQLLEAVKAQTEEEKKRLEHQILELTDKLKCRHSQGESEIRSGFSSEDLTGST